MSKSPPILRSANTSSHNQISTATVRERGWKFLATLCLVRASSLVALTFVPPCLLLACGCIRITINPQCPEEIDVESIGNLVANQANTGAIPTYLWEADPAGRVTIADESEPNTTFEALRSGEVTFTLTASDGLFQMIDTCTTTITTEGEPEPQPEPEPEPEPQPEPQPELTVNFVANPATIVLGEDDPSVLLSCTNTGTTSATLTIDQLDGPPINLTSALPGVSVALFGTVPGTYTFRCLATDSQGNRGDPAVVRVTVTEPTRTPPR